MCRILVLVNPSIDWDTLKQMVMTLSKDGNVDACGFAVFYRDGTWARVRLPVPCSILAEFIDSYSTLRRELTENVLYLLFHARKATQGNPRDNRNNHPFCTYVDGEPVCLIHNGSLKFKDGYKPRMAVTDSAGLLEKFAEIYKTVKNPVEAAKKAWESVEGKASVAVATPNWLLYTLNSKASVYIMRAGDSYAIATSYETLTPLNPKKPVVYRCYGLENEQVCYPTRITILFEREKLVYLDANELIDAGFHTSSTYYAVYGTSGTSYDDHYHYYRI